MSKIVLLTLILAISATANELDFKKLYNAEKNNYKTKKIIIAEDFEKGIVEKETFSPRGKKTGYVYSFSNKDDNIAYLSTNDPNNKARAKVTGEKSSTGKNSLEFIDSSTEKIQSKPYLSFFLYEENVPKKGKLKIAFDMLNPSVTNSHFSLNIRDYSSNRVAKNKQFDNICNITITPKRVFLGSENVFLEPDIWRHYQLILPIGEKDSKATLTITDKYGEKQLFLLNANIVNSITRIIMLLSNKKDSSIFIDNLIISVID